VVTSVAVRRSEPQEAALVPCWPCVADVLDADGALLSGAELPGPTEAGRLALDTIDKPCALLAYCFGRGERQILVSFAGQIVEGRLATRWERDRRSWWLELDE
jgi:hypothetical protein